MARVTPEVAAAVPAAPASSARTTTEPAPLELEGIVKSWRGQPVLDGVALALDAGTVTWLGGRNGTGKTTLLRVATGLILPEAGSVRLAGLKVEGDRRAFQSRLGYLPAGNAMLYARLSVANNLDFWGGMGLVRRADRRRAIERAIQRFELVELRDRRVDRLSMGQRQRVRLAATFLHEPEVVLFDEPHTSLDDEGIELLRSVLGEITAAGGAALWCSPSKSGAELGADVSYVLEGGKLRRA
jgi:ABC-2 type transport system ATP-binding protein